MKIRRVGGFQPYRLESKWEFQTLPACGEWHRSRQDVLRYLYQKEKEHEKGCYQ